MKELIKEIIREELTGVSSEAIRTTSNTSEKGHVKTPVLVCTDKRAVVFGYTENRHAEPITLTDARMCLYWSSATGGVFGLSEKGPNKDCKISATAKRVELMGVTAVFDVEPNAVKAWIKSPVQGR